MCSHGSGNPSQTHIACTGSTALWLVITGTHLLSANLAPLRLDRHFVCFADFVTGSYSDSDNSSVGVVVLFFRVSLLGVAS